MIEKNNTILKYMPEFVSKLLSMLCKDYALISKI